MKLSLEKLSFTSAVLLFIMSTTTLYAQRISDNNLINIRPVLQKRASIYERINVNPQRPTAAISCIVTGITITATGSIYLPYTQQINVPASCYPASSYFNLGAASEPWNINGQGFITYTFSSPVTSATIGYSIVDNADYGTISINGLGNLQLTNPCNLSIIGNTIQGAIPAGSGDVRLTVSSDQPFTSITFRDDPESATLIKQGNLCNFQLTTPPSQTITNCPKFPLDFMCYNTTMAQTTTKSIYTEGAQYGMPALINGVPCTQFNTTIQMVNPLPFGCFLNPNGTLTYPAGTLPFSANPDDYYYRLCSRANPSICSEIYRVDFGIQSTIKTTSPWLCRTATLGSPTAAAGYNIVNNTQYNPTTTGQCNAFIQATAGPTGNIRITETTTPQNPYYRLTNMGLITLRQGVLVSAIPSNQNIRLTYQMCDQSNLSICVDYEVSIHECGSKMAITTLNKSVSEDALDVEIAPNPSKDNFTLFFNSVIKSCNVTIHNIYGQLISNLEFKNVQELQLPELIKGIYIVKIDINGQIFTNRIVKQ